MMGNLLQQGLELTIFGMGTVFVFLVMLIFATREMSRLAIRFGGSETSEASMTADTISPSNSRESNELIAVITAAIQQHRVRNKKEVKRNNKSLRVSLKMSESNE